MINERYCAIPTVQFLAKRENLEASKDSYLRDSIPFIESFCNKEKKFFKKDPAEFRLRDLNI